MSGCGGVYFANEADGVAWCHFIAFQRPGPRARQRTFPFLLLWLLCLLRQRLWRLLQGRWRSSRFFSWSPPPSPRWRWRLLLLRVLLRIWQLRWVLRRWL